MSPLEREIKKYAPAIVLERFFPRIVRKILQIIFLLGTITLVAVVLFYLGTSSFDINILLEEAVLYFGLLLISFSLLFGVASLSFFFNSFYFRGIESIVHERSSKDGGITYEVARALRRDPQDITGSFLTSTYGRDILLRCNISPAEADSYLEGERNPISAESLHLLSDRFITLHHVAKHIYENDASFKEFLFSRGVDENVHNGAAAWVADSMRKEKHDARWWSRESLGRVRGIGADMSYGGAYQLERYTRDIRTSGVFSVLSKDTAYADEKVEQIETILARAKEANVILVGDEGVGKMDIVVRLGDKMHRGEAVAPIVSKRIVIFDPERFIADNPTKEVFEQALLSMLVQAEKAGNIIMVIEHIVGFLRSAEALGSGVGALMDPYLSSSNLQVIATSNPSTYHESIEGNQQLKHHFERVQIESPDFGSTIKVLQGVARRSEGKRIIFTYPSIVAIIESADRYIVDGVMPDKAIGLLTEIVSSAIQKKAPGITKEFVESYMSEKTGQPMGKISEEEKDKLLNLEQILHERVVGQDTAITAVSSTMRRTRVGIQDEKRPIGSFLFLGSTGVGKTETAKALAAVFFGGEDMIGRLDMSEFSDEGALTRLIGGKGTSGILSNMLKEKPFGVLLLDEFEKATSTVHDLFLQIIDEGFFGDFKGQRVSARNSIIIATSNAGSKMIFDYIKQGENPADKEAEIIESVIKEGIYKPELINRFDSVVIFEPLQEAQLTKIGGMLLEDLKDRIKKKGFNLIVNDALVNLLVKEGYDPQFGARPMRRVLQDEIEEKIAEKIISGNLNKGDKIEFTEGDFLN